MYINNEDSKTMYINYNKDFDDIKGVNPNNFNKILNSIKGTKEEGDIEVKISLVIRTKEGNKIMQHSEDIDLVIPLEKLDSNNYFSVVLSVKKALSIQCPSFNEEHIQETWLYPTGFLYLNNILYLCLTLVIEAELVPIFANEENDIHFIDIEDINLKSIPERDIMILPTIPKTRR